jgi:hypothetical protein
MDRVLTVGCAAVAGVGLVDAVISGQTDLAVVFATVLGLLVVLLVRLQFARPLVAVRRDIFGWLRDQSHSTGEPLPRIADRALAAYRAQLSGAGSPTSRQVVPGARDGGH